MSDNSSSHEDHATRASAGHAAESGQAAPIREEPNRLNVATFGDARSESDAIVDPSSARRNFRLTVANGVLTIGSMALFEPTTVIPAFIVGLGGSEALVGLVMALNRIALVWPQVFVARWVEPKPEKHFVYRYGAVSRIGQLLILGAIVWYFRDSLPGWLPYAVLLFMFLHWSSVGFQAVGFADVVPKVIYSRDRPRLFAYRRIGANTLALLFGFVVSWVLSARSGMGFPENYLFLLIAFTAVTSTGVIAYCLVKEPPDPNVPHRMRSWREYMKLGPDLLRGDNNYRNLILGMVTLTMTVMVTPFLVPFLLRRVGTDDSIVGFLMVLAGLSDLLANVLWMRLGTRVGNRSILVTASTVAAICPFAGVAAIFMPAHEVLGVDWRVGLVAVSLVASRVSMGGVGLGNINYLLDIAPRAIRPSYIGFMNVAMMLSWVIPFAAGMAIDFIGYTPVFVTAAVFGIVCSAVFRRLESFAPAR